MSELEQSYRANLREAQDMLDVAERVVSEFKARDMIVWGTTSKGFEGWLVKGAKANEGHTALMRARADIGHWSALLNETLRQQAAHRPDPRLPPERDDEPMTAEQVEARKSDLNRQFEERFGRQEGEAV